MDVIELERWKPSEEDPRKLEYAGQPAAQQVFEELKDWLEGMGYLPDEYFLMGDEWNNGREIPREADIICKVDYGESEGVYLDIGLTWYDKEQKRYVIKDFITGKTLGENGNDLDRMYLTASAVTKAFHGDHATHSRYMKVNGQEDTGGAVVHLSMKEQQAIINALVEQRERQLGDVNQTEQLLRRMTGSITAYMDTVGQRPMRISDFDKAMMAIQDREMKVFGELWSKVKDHADELLIEAAGRSGLASRRMIDVILRDTKQFSEGVYRTACQKAMDAADDAMLNNLLNQAELRMEGYTPAFFGEIAHYGYRDKGWFAQQIIDWCSPEQIAAAPAALLLDTVRADDFPTAWKLSEGGISADGCFAEIVSFYAEKGRPRLADDLLRQGARVSPDNFRALHACIDHDCTGLGKLLLDQGMDLDQYKEWAKRQNHGLRCNDTLAELEEHWQTIQGQEQDAAGPEIGGMGLG